MLVISCFLIYLVGSVFVSIIGIDWHPVKNVNLVSDIFKTEKVEKVEKIDSVLVEQKTQEDLPVAPQKKDFNLYQTPEFITDFTVDSNKPALKSFANKLTELKQTKKGKIRIAYFGDSMIEGDLMTMTLRELLQNEFGGEGVGFVPIFSNIAGFRTTVTASGSGWEDTHFMKKNAKGFYISGHVFTGNGKANFTDKTIKNHSIDVEKSLIFGKGDGTVQYNGVDKNITGIAEVNRVVLANDTIDKFSLRSQTASLPLYGISFESENGVFVDNFSFRGITGIELNKIDDSVLSAIQKNNPYDLIVLQYGVNLMFRAKDTKYDYYAKSMVPVLQKMKKAFEGADFLLIGSADRAFRYNGEYKTAIGLPNLLKLQATMAMENGYAFYNQFESMGGENSIVRWAKEKPSLANKDYIHPNHRGAEILADKLFNSMMKDYKKHSTKKGE